MPDTPDTPDQTQGWPETRSLFNQENHQGTCGAGMMLSDSPAQTGLASIATGPWQPRVLRVAAHTRPGACWVSKVLVSPGKGLGCSCHHLNEHPLSQEAIALQCLWCSPGKREGETSRKGKLTATPLARGGSPAQTRSMEAAVPTRHPSARLTSLLPAQPAAISLELRCCSPEQQSDGSGALG